MLSTPVQQTIFIHVIAFACAHVIAVLYKFMIIIYKVSKYRSLTKTALKHDEGAPQKILIIYASVGSGHKRAAQAIQEALLSELAELDDVEHTREYHEKDPHSGQRNSNQQRLKGGN